MDKLLIQNEYSQLLSSYKKVENEVGLDESDEEDRMIEFLDKKIYKTKSIIHAEYLRVLSKNNIIFERKIDRVDNTVF